MPCASTSQHSTLRVPRTTAEREPAGGTNGGRGGKPPKEVSLTDPQAAWVARKGVDPFFAYDANYLIDNKVGIILDAEGTRANPARRSPSPRL